MLSRTAGRNGPPRRAPARAAAPAGPSRRRSAARPAPPAASSAEPAGRAGLGFDPEEAVAHLRRVDPVLGRFIDRVGALGLETNTVVSPFQAFLETIVYQQLNRRAAAAIFTRVQQAFGIGPGGEIRPFDLLRAPDEELRALGLSRPKIAAIRDLAEHALAERIPPLARLRKMSDEAIIERLTRVRGIGRWTVEMFLIFRLGRPDVLAVEDYGLRKGFARLYGRPDLPGRGEFTAAGEIWRPFRTAASWYLWRANELLK